jgi:import receptor subunit TOM22
MAQLLRHHASLADPANTTQPTNQPKPNQTIQSDKNTTPESEVSADSDVDVEGESLYERLNALKDVIPPGARRNVNSTVSAVTSFAKSSVMFGGKTLWILSTSAFLLGVPWALAYSDEEQFMQMEREQGMIKGANEVGFS